MVLTKLFNILAITTSVGGSVLTTPPQRSNMPNRAVNTYDATITINMQRSVENNILEETKTIASWQSNTITQQNNIWRYTFQNSYLGGEILWFSLSTKVSIWNNDIEDAGYVIGFGENNLEHINGYFDNYNQGLEKYVEVQQDLYLIKLNTTGQLVNTSINIRSSYSDLNTLRQPNQNNIATPNLKKQIEKILTSKSGMADFFSTSFIQNELAKKSAFTDGLYETYKNIIYMNSISTSNESEKSITLTNTNSNWYTTENANVQAYNNNTTYYAYYTEPRITRTGTYNYNVAYGMNNINYNDHILTYNAQLAINPSNQEVIDIPNVMFEVLGMPFTFISTAFNLTLFPGTPYELNVSVLFLSIFAILVFIFLIKILIKVLK